MRLTTKKTWNLEIKGIDCQIVFWTNENMQKEEHGDIYPHKGIWNSYIFINKKSIPKNFKKLIPEIKKVPWENNEKFSYEQLPIDMAYGITFFDVRRKPSGDIISVKIGNNYNHIWNENQYINENIIKQDLEKVVEDIYNLFPNFKIRSNIDGKYVKPEELDDYNKKIKEKIDEKRKKN